MLEANQKTDYQKFLDDKHAKFQTPQQIIDAALLTVSRDKIANQNKIIKGEVNEVYAIKTQIGDEFIIRIGRGEDVKNSFTREKWVLEESQKVGVPVPKVLSIQSFEFEGAELCICIENKLPGVPMKEYKDWKDLANKAEMLELIRKAGDILSRIHSISVKGFGHLNSDGVGKHKSVVERVLNDHEISEDKMIEVAEHNNFDKQIVISALQILKIQWPEHLIAETRLVHHDYGVKHIMVDNGEITGILDFQNAEGGDRAMDFAWWDFWSQDRYPIQFLMEGYKDKKLFESDFELRKNLWKIYLGLSCLGYFDKEQNFGNVEYCKKRLIEDISNF